MAWGQTWRRGDSGSGQTVAEKVAAARRSPTNAYQGDTRQAAHQGSALYQVYKNANNAVGTPGAVSMDSWRNFGKEWANLGLPGRMDKLAGFDFNSLMPQQAATTGGSGGGGGRGGGGGGGAAGISQATIDAMAKVLGIMPQQQTWQDMKLPAFQGQNIAAFNPAPYDQLNSQLGNAYATDMANIATNQQATSQAVQQNYTNPYANAQVAQAPTAAPVGAGLAASAGGDTGALQQAGQANAGAEQGSQAAFQNLYNILSAASQQSQASRQNQVVMDANTGRQNAGAQRTGLAGQIGMQRANAQQQWSQADQDRRYQNSMQAQTWAREQAQANAVGRQSVNQSNVQGRNESITSRIQPLLELLSQTNGVSGVNTNSLMQLLARFGAAA